MRTAIVLLVLLGSMTSIADSAEVRLVAGGGTGKDGGPAIGAKLHEPFGVAWDKEGRLIIVEMGGHCVRRIDAKGVISTAVGTGDKGFGGDGGASTESRLNGPHAILVDGSGTILISDTWNDRVRAIDAKGAVRTVVGSGKKGFGGDGGPALEAKFGGIYCTAVSKDGQRLYVADLDNRRIRKIDRKTGIVTTVAGDGSKGIPRDGSEAIRSPLMDPRAVAVDADENIWILERDGHALRVVDAAGRIRTVAGTGKKGYSGDGGPASMATMSGPKYLCVAPDGSILIADTENHAIRRYTPKDGTITTVAGTGRKGSNGIDGPPEKLQLDRPHGVEVHSSGDIYISDSDNHRVVRIVK